MKETKSSEMAEELDQGSKMEASEHEWLSPEQARRIAQDHLSKYGAEYYEKEEPKEMEAAETEETDDEPDSEGDKMSAKEKVKQALSKKGKAKVGVVMAEFKLGGLHSGSKEGPKVTNRKQAIAIALQSARKAK